MSLITDQNQVTPPKFLHVAYHIHQQLFQDGFMISGFYNWHRVFGGEFSYYEQKKRHFDEYDIIFVGISSPELRGNIISRLRHDITNPKTIIVACVDYAVEMWQGTFNPIHLCHELEKADYIFCAELSMVSHVKSLLPDREIYHIMHPTDIEPIKRLLKPIEHRRNALLSMIHRYDNNWLDMHLVTKDLKEIDVYAILMDHGIEVEVLPFFQFTKKAETYGRFLEFLSEAKVVVDSYHRMHSYGRVPVEAACLKVPVVAPSTVTSARILWPELVIPNGDTFGQTQVVRKLLNEPEFYKKVTDEAFQKVEAVNYPNSYFKFMKMIGRENELYGIDFIDKSKKE